MARNTLDEIIKQEKISLKRLADVSGISERNLRKYLLEKRTPKPGTMQKIGKALNQITDKSYLIKEVFQYPNLNYSKFINYKLYESEKHYEILRTIEFEQEYFLAGLTILNYFGTVLKNRLPESQARVRIEQDGLKVTLVIETNEGEEERIEKFLNDYTLAIIGEKSLEEVTQNQEQLIEIRQQLRLASAQVEFQRDMLNYKNAEVERLYDLFSKSLKPEATTIDINFSGDGNKKKTRFTFTDFLGWAQNGQILFVFFSIITGISVFIIYPKMYPSGLPSWAKSMQNIIPSTESNDEFSENENKRKVSLGEIIKKVTVEVNAPNDYSSSGVIISRQGNIYSVLTTKHSIEKNLSSKDELYISTPDRQQHKINVESIQRIPSLDLTVVEFESDSVYNVIKIGDSENLQLLDQIYIAGFIPPSRIPSPLENSSLYISSGTISGIHEEFLDGGYELRYTNVSTVGLSGGPIVNQTGELVGICGIILFHPTMGTQFGLGIPINKYSEWKSKKLSTK